MTVANFSVTVTNTTRYTLPNQLSSVRSNLQAVAEILRFIVVPHKPQESHVDRGHPKLKSLEMKTEMLTKAIEYRQHPSSVLDLLWIRLHIAMIKGESIMHINFVFIS